VVLELYGENFDGCHIKNRLKLSQKQTTKCYKCQKCSDDDAFWHGNAFK